MIYNLIGKKDEIQAHLKVVMKDYPCVKKYKLEVTPICIQVTVVFRPLTRDMLDTLNIIKDDFYGFLSKHEPEIKEKMVIFRLDY